MIKTEKSHLRVHKKSKQIKTNFGFYFQKIDTHTKSRFADEVGLKSANFPNKITQNTAQKPQKQI